ncbi:MAG: 23S rRNA methyltransferase [Clostridia bacterium]|nr:23S rRNA methyltransferase [Clostridia bacterium]
MRTNSGEVETVVLLSQRKPDDRVRVKIDLDDYDLTKSESKATYNEIKEYVLKNHGLKVSALYIAQIKHKYGIIERENYNKGKSVGAKQPQCTKDKEKAIVDALRHFKMI